MHRSADTATIYLSAQVPTTIDHEAYQRILAIIEESKLCMYCATSYTEHNPMVARNICSSCMITLQRESGKKTHTYVGTFTDEPFREGQHPTPLFWFLDESNGHIYISSEFEEQLRESCYHTLLYWGFSVPKTYETPQRSVPLYPSEWYITGDVRTKSAVIIYHRVDDKYVYFLTYKGGSNEPLSRHSGKVKRLFEKAEARIEATRDSGGKYHIGDEIISEFDRKDTAYVHLVIVDIASEEYDATQAGSLWLTTESI